MKIAVIAGTSDAADYIAAHCGEAEITAFVATPYGAQCLAHLPAAVHIGRLNRVEFAAALAGFDAVTDCSHPFAEEVSRNVQWACRLLGLPYTRLARQGWQGSYARLTRTADFRTAAERLNQMPGRILLTTGSKTLGFFAAQVHDPSRITARILDTPESRALTQGLPVEVIYALPPFDTAQNIALIEKSGAQILVSKDSGARGGVPEKIQAAAYCGIDVLLIDQPAG